MKNIFQKGLALGIPSVSCSCSNMDFEWLYANPMNLLWMDNLVITQNMWNLVMSECHSANFGKGKEDVFAKSNKLIYSILNDVGLVKILPDGCIDEDTKNEIYSQIESDLELLGNSVKEEDDLLWINRYCYCIPSLWTLYASLFLSRQNNAGFMLFENELSYLKTILPLKYPNMSPMPIARRATAINEVLKMALPNFKVGHEYLFDSMERCSVCVKIDECKDSYLSKIEKQVFTILEYREREEINQLCTLMDRICSEKFLNDYEIAPSELMHEINVERVKVQRKINKIYRTFERWKNVVMTVSAGMTLGGFFSYPTLAAVGASGVLATNVADKILTEQEKKSKWVNLFNN